MIKTLTLDFLILAIILFILGIREYQDLSTGEAIGVVVLGYIIILITGPVLEIHHNFYKFFI